MNRMYIALAVVALSGAALAPQETRAEEHGQAARDQAQTRLVEQNRHLAEAAQRESAATASEALRDETRLDLEIRFVDHTSVLIAGDFKELL